MSLLLISSERFADHITPPGHPERVERAQVFDAVAAAWRAGGGQVGRPRPATREELLAVHTAEHCQQIANTVGRARTLDPDTFTSPDSYEVALLAAGAVCVGVDHALHRHAPALALVRPPGHHAERDAAMGFCLYNNVAVGAAYALARGLSRVAIVDIDVHHGNGTQWIFYDDPRVLYVSAHQYPFYPGTGAATEIGHGDGEGRTINLPLAAGATDADYDLVFREVINPAVADFAPELLFVSAGFDAHVRDPLASMRVTTAGYRRMIDYLWTTASAVADGRLVAVTEGGYDLQALRECLDQTVDALASPARMPDPLSNGANGANGRLSGATASGTSELADTERGRDAIHAVRVAQAGRWPVA
jgi:acetoin utilization deacetylase AcuC-like enzyme